MTQSYRFVVTGRVQGVWFRQSAKARADGLSLRGWVRNRVDGAVEGVVAGEDPMALTAFHDWLGRGPSHAEVKNLQWVEIDESLRPGFEVRG